MYSGLGLARTLRDERPGIAFLYMSGYSSWKILEEAQAHAMGELILEAVLAPRPAQARAVGVDARCPTV